MTAPAQFGVHRTGGGTLVVVVQSDLLADISTRVVVPLVEPEAPGAQIRRLNPILPLGDRNVMLLTQQIATLTSRELGAAVGSLSHVRDDIVRAIDTLLSGV